jgi:hypothetical protein
VLGETKRPLNPQGQRPQKGLRLLATQPAFKIPSTFAFVYVTNCALIGLPAYDVGVSPFPRDEPSLLKLFNLHTGWFLDYRSAVVREIHALCIARLDL